MDSFWQAVSEYQEPEQPTLEFRLYYDDAGRVLFYSMEQLPGKYVQVTSEQYAEGRYDVTVVNGEIKYPVTKVYRKLVPSKTGTATSLSDVTIISPTETDAQFWKAKIYEQD